MKVYTSYFGNLKNLSKAGIVPVSIARYSPKWYEGLEAKEVAPTSYMLTDKCSREEYIRRYKDILWNMSLEIFKAKLEYFGQGKDVALLCYEKPGDFCHRHLLADYLNENGWNVEEFTQPQQVEVQERKQAVQMSLF